MYRKENQLTRFGSDFLEIAPFLAEILTFGAKVMTKWIGYQDANIRYMQSLV